MTLSYWSEGIITVHRGNCSGKIVGPGYSGGMSG